MPTVHDFAISLGGSIDIVNREDVSTDAELAGPLPDKAYAVSGRFFGGAASVSMHRGVKRNLRNDLRAYFRFDNNLTSSFGDTRTLSGLFTPAYATSKLGTGLWHGLGFTGTPINGMSGSVGTISLWVQRNQDVTGGVQLGSSPVLNLTLGGLTGDVKATWNSVDMIATQQEFAAVGEWVFLLITYDKLKLRLYINGQFYGQASLIDAGMFNGAVAYASSQALGNVLIDESGIWSRILTDVEIKKLWNNGAGFDPTK